MQNFSQAQSSTALVIDDDDFSQAAFGISLKAIGLHHIQYADNGSDGLRIFDNSSPPPDFLICDIFMPDMDGVEFIMEMHKRAYQGGMILVSSNPMMLHIAQKIAIASNLKLLGSFAKPLHTDALAHAMGYAPNR
jgi:response regulator of citrate/malate metabolism